MTAAPESRLLGRLIDGRYRVDRVLRDEASGTVYAAYHLGLSARVALKVPSLPEGLTAEDRAGRGAGLLEEARTLKLLDHPNIVAALDAGELPADESGERTPYLVIDACEGPTLKEMLGRRERETLPLDDAWRLFEPVVDALAHAHARGVAHCALSAEKVIMTDHRGRPSGVRLVDFGHAEAISLEDELHARAREGPAMDVRALALLFVEMAGASLPEALEDVLHRARSVEPTDRYVDAASMGAAMRRALGSRLPHELAAPETSSRLEPPPTGRHRGRWAALGVLALAAATTGGVLARRATPPSGAPERLRDLDIETFMARLSRLHDLGHCVEKRQDKTQFLECETGLVWFSGDSLASMTPKLAREYTNHLALVYANRFPHARYAVDAKRGLLVVSRDDATMVLRTILAGASVDIEAEPAASRWAP